MIQKDYLIKKPFMGKLAPVVADICSTLKKTPHRDALLIIYETGFSELQIKGLIEALKMPGFPEIKIAGISCFAIADLPPDGSGIRLNLLVSETSEFEVVTMECALGREDEAASILRDRLHEHEDIRAVELFACSMKLNTTRFIESAMKDHADIPVFGTMTASEMPKSLRARGSEGFSLFEIGINNIVSNQKAIGSRFVTEGYVAILYSGEELDVRVNYALGWRAVGREMDFERAPAGYMGETVVSRINGSTAVELYHEYLGVCPDRHLITNICEFPLMVTRDGMDICMVPFDYGDNGELYFNITLHEDEKLRFSFASYDEVLDASEDSFIDMKKYNPQAMFLIMCGNRLNLLKEDAPVEWDKFKELSPDCAIIHGACEIYYQGGRGGILNSAHLAIGFREGAVFEGCDQEDKEKRSIKAKDVCKHLGQIVPLSERMSVFLSKMTTDLEDMAAEAQAANQAKSAFLSNMSHEIRTPINAVLGMDEMILRESSEPQIIGYAEDIRSAGTSLLGIVNDILDFSKIEAGKMDIIPVEYEFLSVVNDLYNLIRKRAEDKDLKLILELDPKIPSIMYGDEIRIKQVITNILTNAVKYTEKGSVTFTVKRLDDDDETSGQSLKQAENETSGQSLKQAENETSEQARVKSKDVRLKVSIKDTGIGIKEEDIDKLYNAFERIEEERNRTVEGTGLGMNITGNLLSLMGSSLSVNSVYGEGSEFSFVIDQKIVRDEPIGEISERFTKSNAMRGRYRERFKAPEAKILVVDDTSMNLDVIKNLLKKTKIQIDTALSGAEALELVKKEYYDIIFLDHRMPQMDGMECLKRMRGLEDHKCPDSPVISLTANAISGAREEYINAGFADYLSKPIDSGKLEEMLIRYLPADKVKIMPDKAGTDKTRKTTSKYSHAGESPIEENADVKPVITLIDDDRMIHLVAKNILGRDYDICTYLNGDDGLDGIRMHGASLILLDVKMPGKDGFEVLDELKSDPELADIPVIFLTGDDSKNSEVEGFKAGVWDFVRKPFAPDVLLQRVRHTIDLSHLQKDLAHQVEEQTQRADHLSEEIMMALSQTVDAKDHYTKGHSERVAGYSTMLAMKMGMSRIRQAQIHAMGLLHDVGKIGVPEDIINKPDKLSDSEFNAIKEHTTMGYDILKTITEMPELATGARWHHERYDGSGYPDGKAGEEIPLEARIICVADSYDAMTSSRSYSDMRAQEEVRSEFVRCCGTQFDPQIARYMIEIIDSDTSYKMNELGYRDSEVASYVQNLLETTVAFGTDPVKQTASGSPALINTLPGDMPDHDSEAESKDKSAQAAERRPEEKYGSGAGYGAEGDYDEDVDDDSDDIALPKWLADDPDIDTGSAVANCGSVEGFLSVLSGFHASIADKADEIENYYNNEDWDNYTIKVHALKSSSRVIGLNDLSRLAQELEDAGDNKDIGTIRLKGPDLLDKYRSYIGSLSLINPDEDNAGRDLPAADEAMIEDALTSMKEFVRNMDHELMGMVIDQMSGYALPEADASWFEEVKKGFRDLDWDRMQQALDNKRIN